jgi:CheY-like chemotaxis protein
MSDLLSSSPRLLLVESNEDEAVLFQRVFGSVARHWRLLWEKDGSAAARQILNHGFPDLLVTRIELPRLNGIDLVEWVRSLRSPRFVQVAIYDRTPASSQREQLSLWGVEEYLDKRSPPEKMKAILRRIISKIELEAAESAENVNGLPQVLPGFSRTHPRPRPDVESAHR